MGNLRAIAIFVGFLLIVATFTYPSWRPRPVIETAEDIFPELDPELRPQFDTLPSDVQTIYLVLRQDNSRIAEALVSARLTPPERLIEELPNISNAVRVASGIFAPVVLPADEFERELPPYQSLYEALGDITVYRYPDERKFLRLENFSVVNGPDLRVYLATTRDPLNLEELGNTYLDLGALRSNSGNQNYDIPREVSISSYASVVIFDRISGHIFAVGRIG
jgi:hypothetical protein